jgi:uncharacterized protein
MKSCIVAKVKYVLYATIEQVNEIRYLEGIKLFNNEAFFEAHEVLEDVWRAAVPEHRKFLQGLIQVAVAFHHHNRGNLVGAKSLLARALRNLSGYAGEFRGIQLARLRSSLSAWQVALAEEKPLPPLPKIHPQPSAITVSDDQRAESEAER